jgi:hypothetical protein
MNTPFEMQIAKESFPPEWMVIMSLHSCDESIGRSVYAYAKCKISVLFGACIRVYVIKDGSQWKCSESGKNESFYADFKSGDLVKCICYLLTFSTMPCTYTHTGQSLRHTQ